MDSFQGTKIIYIYTYIHINIHTHTHDIPIQTYISNKNCDVLFKFVFLVHVYFIRLGRLLALIMNTKYFSLKLFVI